MMKYACILLLSLTLVPLALVAGDGRAGSSRARLHSRSQIAEAADIPDYILVTPDQVAMAPSGPSGLASAGLNNMMCLVNRQRFNRNLTTMALDAGLIRYAQSRAEFLASSNATIESNSAARTGNASMPTLDKSRWLDVKENLLYTTNNPTKAQWMFEEDPLAMSNILLPNATYFGAGYQDGYYVQVFGKPVDFSSLETDTFPWCPANETFWNWVYPSGIPGVKGDGDHLHGTFFPYKDYQNAVVNCNTQNLWFDNGRVNGTETYGFLPTNGTVPFMKSIDALPNVAPANSSTPFQAIAGSGEQGMTKDELNLMACLINARRYASCLPPLALHPKLIASAQAQSYMMNRALNMSHFSSGGPEAQRVKRRGFVFSTLGENVGSNLHNVVDAHGAFSESQGHLNNILGVGYAFFGVGRSGQYWTVDFSTPMDTKEIPDPRTVPLCPGNETAIAIAFPNGLPKEPRLQKTACGGTVATSVPYPPYILSQMAKTVSSTLFTTATSHPRRTSATAAATPTPMPTVATVVSVTTLSGLLTVVGVSSSDGTAESSENGNDGASTPTPTTTIRAVSSAPVAVETAHPPTTTPAQLF